VNRCGRYSLLIRNGRIVDINPSAQTLISLYPGAGVVDARDRIVIPGFINAHFHGESVLLRLMTRRAPFGSWNAHQGLRSALARLLDPSAAPDVAALYGIAGILHLRSGTTTVAGYPAPYTPAVLQGAVNAIAGAGIRFMIALQSWDQIEGFRSSPTGPGGCSISLGPEEGYTVYSLENFVRVSAETQFPLAAHIGETRAETDALRGRFKKSPLRILKDSGALVPGTHLIHCNHIPENDLDLLGAGANPLTLCIRSALAKQTGYPLLRSLASRDVALCLGTDWGDTDLLAEIGALRNLRRYVSGVPAYEPLELMRMATINGAHALGIASQTGSLEVGKHADLVMIAFDDVRLPSLSANPPAEEIAELITDYCDTGMISDVMVQGVFGVRNREAVRVDEKEMLRNFRQIQGMYIPAVSAEHHGERFTGVPLASSDRNGKAPLFGQGEAEDDSARERKANMTPPGPASGESQQKFPVVTKKISKVFGEDDI